MLEINKFKFHVLYWASSRASGGDDDDAEQFPKSYQVFCVPRKKNAKKFDTHFVLT